MGYPYIPGTPNYNAAVKAPREALTIGLDYYTVTTAVNITPQAVGPFYDVPNLAPVMPVVPFASNTNVFANATEFVPGTIPNDFSQDALDRLIEIISQRGQPVIMGAPSGSGPYTFKFAIEHPASWGVIANASLQAVPALANAIQMGGIDYGFGTGPDTPVSNGSAGLVVTVCTTF